MPRISAGQSTKTKRQLPWPWKINPNYKWKSNSKASLKWFITQRTAIHEILFLVGLAHGSTGIGSLGVTITSDVERCSVAA